MVFRQAYNMKYSNGKITFNREVINLESKISERKITLLVKLYNNIYISICIINNIQSKGIELILGVFLCGIIPSISFDINDVNIILIGSDYIAGINNNVISHLRNSGNIPVQFMINKIIDNNENQNSFILKGVTTSDIIENINFSIFITFYNKQANCILSNTSKLIQTLITCKIPDKLWPIISIESQIILKNDIEILLIKGQENIISENINSFKLINLINQTNYLNNNMNDLQNKFVEYKGNNINNQISNDTLIFLLNPRVNETFLLILLNWSVIVIKLLYIYAKLNHNKATIKSKSKKLAKIT